MKDTSAKRASLASLVLVLAPAALIVAGMSAPVVGCNNTTAGAGDAFVGTWSCPGLPAGARTLVITQNLDTSLNLSSDTTGIDASASVSVADGGEDAGVTSTGPFCASDLWTYAGNTVTLKNETSCLGGSTGTDVLLIESLSLTVNGKTLVIAGGETVSSGGELPDGAPTAKFTKQTVNLAATCTKQ